MALQSFDILDAYRADLDQAHVHSFTEADAGWILLGTILQRATALPVAERSRYLNQAWDAVSIAPAPCEVAAPAAVSVGSGLDPRLFDAVCHAATCAEDHGAFAVAMVLLDSMRFLVGASHTAVQGRLLYLQARVLRKVGELERADRILGELLEMGESGQLAALVGWAHVGLGVNARIRGNHPRAREAFNAALACAAPAPDDGAIRSHAHHGLLISCVAARDFSSALVHGIAALQHAENPQRRTEMFTNIAAVCYELGDYRSALLGYLRVLGESPASRIYINALGGAALSAGKLGDARSMRELARRGEQLLVRESPAHELADMACEIAEAYLAIGDREAFERMSHVAVERAKRGDFFELLHRIEQLEAGPHAAPAAPRRAPILSDARAAIQELVVGDADELLAAAVSSGLPDS